MLAPKNILLPVTLFFLYGGCFPASLSSNSIRAVNNRPIIGILSQKPSSSLSQVAPNSTSYIAASYVKWVESQGARAVPIRINQNDSYYAKIFESINGLLIPGGSTSLSSSGYSKAGSILYDLAVTANDRGDYFPVFGICLGFELLLYLSAGKHNYLTSCNSYDRAIPLKFLQNANTSALFGSAPSAVLTTLNSKNSTANFHHWCMTSSNFTSSGLGNVYNPLATSVDDGGLTFIASIEDKKRPISGLQFHPEKNLFEWGYDSIPHSREAVQVGEYFAEYFITQARQNTHRFASVAEEKSYLIYNYQPIFTGSVSKSFEQCYFFD